MARGQSAAGDQTTNGGRADVQDHRGLVDRRLTAFGAFSWSVDGDVILMPQGADAAARPAVAVAGRLAKAIEYGGDRLVGHVARQGAHEINDIVVSAPVRPAMAVLLHRQTCVIAALPVNDQLQHVANDIDDYLRNDGADNLLACLRRGSRAIPGDGQVSPERAVPGRRW